MPKPVKPHEHAPCYTPHFLLDSCCKLMDYNWQKSGIFKDEVTLTINNMLIFFDMIGIFELMAEKMCIVLRIASVPPLGCM